ncbi:response regulator [Candidatus Nitrospira bockiana]
MKPGGHSEYAPSIPGRPVILLVEDNTSIRLIFNSGLEQHGFTVLGAKNAQEALKACKEYPETIHLLVTDLGLPEELRLATSGAGRPGLKGLELMRRVLTLRPSIKVILMSGQSEQCLQQSGVLQTGWPLLRKPFGLDALLRHVRLFFPETGT